MNTEQNDKLFLEIEAYSFDVEYNENDIEGTQKRIEEVKQSATKLEELAKKMGISDIVEQCKGNIPCILEKIKLKSMEVIQEMANEEEQKKIQEKKEEQTTYISRMR